HSLLQLQSFPTRRSSDLAREAGVMEERQRMAAEIHDTLAQGLTGIITQLQAAHQADDWRRNVDNAVQLARESLAEARRSVHAVRSEEHTSELQSRENLVC